MNFVSRFVKVKDNRILFETFKGEVKDHPYFVYKYLVDNNIHDFDIKWCITKGNDVSRIKKSEIVYKKTLSYYYLLMTSKYWIRTHSIETIVNKKDNQVYIQMWHGPGCTKKEGFDTLPESERIGVIPHAKEWDYYIATDEASKEYIKTATGFNKTIVMIGNSRTDYLMQATPTHINRLKEKYKIKENEKVILYAPTFRESDIESEVVHMKIHKICKLDNVRVILRLHPLLSDKIDLSEYGDNIIDGNKVAQITDLYLISDLMITDYSSVAFDYLTLNKPIIFYCYDIKLYQKERGFYFDYLNNLGGPLVEYEDDLVDCILRSDKLMDEYRIEYEKYKDFYNSTLNDGRVCERFVKMLREGDFV
ncbi:MAG: CDP-glycerol glycerophosphotransferase family protein [Erysipelotrichaceae bacterium]